MNITVLHQLGVEDDPTTRDVVVDQVTEALKEKGHNATLLGTRGDVSKVKTTLARRKPDLVFNLADSFGEGALGAVGLVGFLDLLGVPYTGGGPGEFYIQEDKALAKKLLAFDKVPYPDFAVFGDGADLETGGRLRMPLFVKPLRMDASIGINARSLVRSTTELLERVRHIHKKIGDDALAEEYIEGRELYVGVLGNNSHAKAFPPIEMDFSGMPEGKPHVVDAKAKWDEKSVEYKGTNAVLADLPDELRARLQKVALDAYRALRVRDYGRVDLRLTEGGDIYVIEVNASCYLEKGSEFATAGAAAGLDYPALIDSIVEAARARQERRKK